MIQKIIIILFLITSVFSCNTRERKGIGNGFIISCSIKKNNLNTKKAFLKKQEFGNLITIDSTTITNKGFQFKGKINSPSIYGIYIEDIDGVIGLFMENTQINVEVNIDNLEQSKITGSKTNDEYLEFIRNSNEIISKMNVYFPEFQKARAENNIEKLEEINSKMKEINNENTNYILKYAKNNPDSYISAVALNSILSIPTVPKDTIRNIYNNFSDYVKKGDISREIEFFLQTSEPIHLDSILTH